MKRPVNRLSTSNHRRGSVLILVLACCAVAVSLVMISLQVSLQQRRQLRSELQLEQTRWVLDAAIRKSIATPPDQAKEFELKPKLKKFDRVSFHVTPASEKNHVSIQAKVENDAETNVTARSASFEIPD